MTEPLKTGGAATGKPPLEGIFIYRYPSFRGIVKCG